jgi:hypothetical protein
MEGALRSGIRAANMFDEQGVRVEGLCLLMSGLG